MKLSIDIEIEKGLGTLDLLVGELLQTLYKEESNKTIESFKLKVGQSKDGIG